MRLMQPAHEPGEPCGAKFSLAGFTYEVLARPPGGDLQSFEIPTLSLIRCLRGSTHPQQSYLYVGATRKNGGGLGAPHRPDSWPQRIAYTTISDAAETCTHHSPVMLCNLQEGSHCLHPGRSELLAADRCSSALGKCCSAAQMAETECPPPCSLSLFLTLHNGPTHASLFNYSAPLCLAIDIAKNAMIPTEKA